ncbi:serine hydrolase [candidate division WWE3 bacterium]|jgi:beta-lactamase class A|uniref:Serine hydrolase n=1 Tax=candidate division WWE3 bacterium TaxID=2053526 RepID=A0A3A4ZAX6_UNCKA|nr:MAG: serine hydrolase [candidate division WWE3 bacterium]
MTFKKLIETLKNELNQLEGHVALKVKFLNTGDIFEHNPDLQLWAASVIKVPIACEFFRQVSESKFDPQTRIMVSEDNFVDAAGVIKHLSRDIQYPAIDLVKLMLIVSDNSATNQIIDLVGWESIEKYTQELGLRDTTFRHKMMIKAGRGPNLTTANDMTSLLEMLYNHKLSGSQEILDYMNEQLDRTRIALYLPNDIKVPRKYGSLPEAMHEVGVVYSKSPFIFSFLSDDQKDKRMTNEILSKCAKYCFDYSNI